MEKIFNLDLAEMNNLEYLNMANNSICSIEKNSFSNLIKLETLILSFNKLASFHYDILTFKSIEKALIRSKMTRRVVKSVENGREGP